MARHKLYPESVKPGIPKVGPLPAGWRAVPFGDLLRPVVRPADLDDDATYQLVTAKRSRGGIVPREELRGEEIKTKTQFYVQGGDFLISRRQIVHGACGFVPDDLSGAVVSGEYDVLTVQDGLLPEYLEAFTHTTYFQQSCFQSSVGVDIEKMVFDLDHWFTYPMPVPPLAEQRRIADVLGSIRAAFRANQRALAQARRVRKALLQRLLTEGIGHTRFKQTEIGPMPAGWEVVRLGDVCVEGGRYGAPVAKSQYRADWPRYVRITDITDDGELTPEAVSIAPDAATGYLLAEGDVVIARSGATVGKSLRYQARFGICAYAGYLIRYRPDQTRMLPEFLSVWLTSHAYWEWVKATSRTGAQPNINAEEYGSLRLPCPSVGEQRAMVTAMASTDRQIASLVATLDRLSNTSAVVRDTLHTGTL